MSTPSAKDPVRHVVVLMLENRSFDQMLGDFKRVEATVDGIDRNAPRSNADGGNPAIAQAPDAGYDFDKAVDFGHEPENVARQINRGGEPMSGFVADFRRGAHGQDDALARQVMAYYPFGANPAADALPALQGLARNFTVCDRWFASVPGPTWPNRFFMLTGTSAGWAHMPQAPGDPKPPYVYHQETIFGRCADAGLKARVYHGGISNVLLLSRMWLHPSRFSSLDAFFDDAAGEEAQFPHYAFIEPDFFGGDASDQHPPHHVLRGDALVAKVYNAIRRNARLWESTLLVVVHDEHGGFYDHVTPPAAVPPGDPPQDGFAFDELGVRVPAVLVSPYLARGVCSAQFDHTSVLRYVSDKWDLEPLSKRAAAANSIAEAFAPAPQLRADTPKALVVAKIPATKSKALVLDRPNGLQESLLTAYERLPAAVAAQAAPKVARGMKALVDATPAPGAAAGLAARHAVALERGRAMRDALMPSTRPLTVLAVHGIGNGDAHREWQAAWREAIVAQVKRRPQWGERDVEVVFATYDDAFEQFPLGPLQIAEALLRLSGGLVSGTVGAQQRGISDPLKKFDERVRWTAGMVVQWVDEPKLRKILRDRVAEQIEAAQPELIAAHSLGSLVCYDLFRRQVADGAAQSLDGRFFFTFGSQIANPAVRTVFDGRIEPLHADGHGFAHWFHFFNPDDHVFTAPLPVVDPLTTNLTTLFDAPGVANHDGERYLAHPATVPAWSALVEQLATTREMAPPAASVAAAAKPPHAARTAPLASVERTRPSKHRALLIGINDYPDPRNRLEGCVNDTFLMSAVLQEQGIAAEQIRLVLDSRATRAGVMQRLDWLMDGAKDGDLRVLFYSGHGAQIPSYDDQAEADGDDETLVFHDFDWSRATAFTDNDFRKFYSQLPYGVHFLSIFDCCHSGGMTRDGSRCRGISPPDDIRHRALRWNAAHEMWVERNFVETRGRAGRLFARPPSAAERPRGLRSLGQCEDLRALPLKPGDMGSARTAARAARKAYGHKGPFMPLLMYACAEDELASEYVHGSTSYGAFTFVLTKLFRKSKEKPGVATLTKLIEATKEELVVLNYRQTPEMVGPSSKYSDKTRLADLQLAGKPPRKGKART